VKAKLQRLGNGPVGLSPQVAAVDVVFLEKLLELLRQTSGYDSPDCYLDPFSPSGSSGVRRKAAYRAVLQGKVAGQFLQATRAGSEELRQTLVDIHATIKIQQALNVQRFAV